jgi:hypothetical protein
LKGADNGLLCLDLPVFGTNGGSFDISSGVLRCDRDCESFFGDGRCCLTRIRVFLLRSAKEALERNSHVTALKSFRCGQHGQKSSLPLPTVILATTKATKVNYYGDDQN